MPSRRYALRKLPGRARFNFLGLPIEIRRIIVEMIVYTDDSKYGHDIRIAEYRRWKCCSFAATSSELRKECLRIWEGMQVWTIGTRQWEWELIKQWELIFGGRAVFPGKVCIKGKSMRFSVDHPPIDVEITMDLSPSLNDIKDRIHILEWQWDYSEVTEEYFDILEKQSQEVAKALAAKRKKGELTSKCLLDVANSIFSVKEVEWDGNIEQ